MLSRQSLRTRKVLRPANIVNPKRKLKSRKHPGSISGKGVRSLLEGNPNAKLCLVRSVGGLGDILMITPSLREIKRRWPSCDLTFAVNQGATHDNHYYGIIKNAPFLDHIEDTRYLDHSKYNKVVDVSAVCIPYENRKFPPRNRIDLFAHYLGLESLANSLPFYRVEPEEEKWAKDFYGEHFKKGSPIIALHTASIDERRTWPIQNQLDMIRYLRIRIPDLQFLILDWNRLYKGNWEKDFVDVAIASNVNVRPMAALIQQANVFIGPDSGPMHLAGALSIPSVVTFGAIPPQARINHYPTHKAVVAEHIKCRNCIHPGELVITSEGAKNIEDIEIGDKVFDAHGKLQTVQKTFIEKNTERMLEVYLTGLNLPLRLTANHKVPCMLHRKALKVQRKKNLSMEMEHKKVGELERKDYLYVPKPILMGTGVLKTGFNSHHSATTIPEEVKLDYDLAWFLGMFIAEGCAAKGGSNIQFTTSESEQKVREKLLTIGEKYFWIKGTCRKQEGCGAIDVHFASASLARAFRRYFGANAHEKKIPLEIVPHNIQIVRGLLDGILCGDGYNNRGTVVLGTVSRTLAYQVRMLGTLLDQVPKLYLRKKQTNYAYCEYYRVEFCAIKNDTRLDMTKCILAHDKKWHRAVAAQNGFYIRIDHIKEIPYKDEVYNLTVSGSHTYNIAGIGVHNCWYSSCAFSYKCMRELPGANVGKVVLEKLKGG